MSVQIIDNFELSSPKPIDNRIVVGPAYFYKTRSSITLPYEGMRVYDLNDNTTYVYKSSGWAFEVDKISATNDNSSTSTHYLSFFQNTSGNQSIKISSSKLKYTPSTGQILISSGTINSPTLAFVGKSYYETIVIDGGGGGPIGGGGGFIDGSGGFVDDEFYFTAPILEFILVQKYSGLYSPSTTTLGISVNEFESFRFQYDPQTPNSNINTSNGRLVIKSNSSNTRGNGALQVSDSSGNIYSEYNYSSNAGRHLIYNLSPSAIVVGNSYTSVQQTALEFYNSTTSSTYKVRDYHYINTESRRGILSIGSFLGVITGIPATDGLDQFLFYMKEVPTSTSGFFNDGTGKSGGLFIKEQLRVGKTTNLVGDVRLGTDYSSNGTGRLILPFGSESFPSLTFNGGATGMGIYTGPDGGSPTNWWESGLTFVINQNNLTGTSKGRRFRIKAQQQTSSPFSPSSPNYGTDFVLYSNSFISRNLTIQVFDDSSVGSTKGYVNFNSNSISSINWELQDSMNIKSNTAITGTLSVSTNTTSPKFSLTSNGSAGSPSITLNDSNSGIYRETYKSVSISVNGFNKATFAGNDFYISGYHNTGGVGTTASISSGRYDPTLSGTSTCSATASNSNWMRVGQVISVSGRVLVTSTGATCSFKLSLPVAANYIKSGTFDPRMDVPYRLNGVGIITSDTSISQTSQRFPNGAICAIGGGNSINAQFTITHTSSFTGVVYYQYQYCTDIEPDDNLYIDLDGGSGGGLFDDPFG